MKVGDRVKILPDKDGDNEYAGREVVIEAWLPEYEGKFAFFMIDEKPFVWELEKLEAVEEGE